MDNKKSKLPFAALIAAALYAVLVIASAFLPAVKAEGTDYLRWQVTFFYEPDFILDKKMFDPNVWLILSMILPVIAIIFAMCMWKNAKAKTRAVLMTIIAAVNLYAGGVVLNTTTLAKQNATARMMEIINPAIANGTYKNASMTIVCGIAAIAVALLAAAGAFLNYKVASTAEYKEAVEAENKEKALIRDKIRKGELPKPIVPVKSSCSHGTGHDDCNSTFCSNSNCNEPVFNSNEYILWIWLNCV